MFEQFTDFFMRFGLFTQVAPITTQFLGVDFSAHDAAIASFVIPYVCWAFTIRFFLNNVFNPFTAKDSISQLFAKLFRACECLYRLGMCLFAGFIFGSMCYGIITDILFNQGKFAPVALFQGGHYGKSKLYADASGNFVEFVTMAAMFDTLLAVVNGGAGPNDFGHLRNILTPLIFGACHRSQSDFMWIYVSINSLNAFVNRGCKFNAKGGLGDILDLLGGIGDGLPKINIPMVENLQKELSRPVGDHDSNTVQTGVKLGVMAAYFQNAANRSAWVLMFAGAVAKFWADRKEDNGASASKGKKKS